jgi:uncharacterized membrane protein YeaQ/YmgE (transglycosylase-associated protein family)
MDLLILILSWALCGLIVGLIARLLVPGPHPLGVLGTIVLGIVGAFVGGLIHRLISDTPGTLPGGAWSGWIFSIVGAVIVLVLYSWWRPRTTWRRGWW